MQRISDNAFRGILHSMTPRLRAFARMLSNMPQFADDLVHQVLIQAWEQRYRAPNREEIDEWLFYLLRNYYYMDRRRTVAGAIRIVKPAGRMRLRSHASQALARLPDLQREVIILFDASGFECQQIARIVGSTVGTVKTRLSNARRRLMEVDKGSKSNFAKGEAIIPGVANRPQLH